LFPAVTFLKCVVTEVALFSIVAFKTLIFHKVVTVATHLRCGGIFIDHVITNNFFLIPTVKEFLKSVNIWQS